MTGSRSFKQKLSEVYRLWGDQQYDQAVGGVEELLEAWPGNAHLHIVWASLVQLQENPGHSLDEVKKALQRAVEMDKNSPAGPIELGHFLDNVEDNPLAASKAFAQAESLARRSLVEALLGKVKALLQLKKRKEAAAGLAEVFHLLSRDPAKQGSAQAANGMRVGMKGNTVVLQTNLQFDEPFAGEIEGLLNELLANRSA